MNSEQLVTDVAAILAGAAPLIIATMGETITERAGVVNLSLDGKMLLGAMTGFVAGLYTQNVLIGFLVAALVGMLVALVLCVLSLSLQQSQLAVGFVLALLCTDLSSFLGHEYVRVPGVAVPNLPVPLLADLPVLGPLLFDHSPLVYASFVLVPLVWWWLSGTRSGLVVRSLGERPEAAHSRGVHVVRWRYGITLIGGALVGLAGAAYSLDLKQGWSHRHTAGLGWIALAIVIFGGWSPWRVALGCYVFGALQIAAIRWQSALGGFPTQVLQVAPFALMIVILVLVNMSSSPAVRRHVDRLPGVLRRPLHALFDRLAVAAPAALGKPFDP
ncbi:MAG: ABC transporter permease [Chloroflexaceae bacterium]|nr:ABC transporter permease [Chloroflexaceae bacterium]